MKLSFIVSTFNRPHVLRCLLSSLALQTENDFEVIVTDNSDSPEAIFETRLITSENRFRYIKTNRRECYSSAEDGAAVAKGDFLCFPSDDNYYLPQFAELMLRHAINGGYDLVYCDCVYGRPNTIPKYFQAHPRLNHIDKGGFIINRKMFTEFPEKDVVSCSDGRLIENLVRSGIKHSKADGVLWVHN